MIDEKVQRAQRVTGLVMAGCVASWYLPVVSGVACNVAEKKMVKEIVEIILGREDDALAERLFWYHRKKFLVVDLATYLPWAGPPFQILEAYSLGQLAIRFLTRYGDRAEEVALNEVWASVEADMHSAPRVIESFREFTGTPLPEIFVGPVTLAVEKFYSAVQAVQNIPYVAEGQEVLGGALERASHWASSSAQSAVGAVRGWFRG